MPIPTYDRFIEPILRFLADHPDGCRAPDAHNAAADALGLTPAERAEVLPSGVQTVYKNRSGWAHDRLKRAGLSASPRRGFWQLTPQGFEFARAHPAPIPDDVVEKLAVGYLNVRLRPDEEPEAVVEPVLSGDAKASPDDRLEAAVRELKESVANELLEAIGVSSPDFFERLVLELLQAMGYGSSREDLQHVGHTGDGGIDGIISLDRLGLEKVYVQAKRWKNTVGRPDVQGFFGALAGLRAKKGVFITTSDFSPQASEFARSVEGMVLVDGTRLASLMIEHGVGVTPRVIKVPKFDSDYFED